MKRFVDAGDVDPSERLTNSIAKRKARRYLGKARMQACGFDMSSAAPPAAAATGAKAPAPAAAPAKK